MPILQNSTWKPLRQKAADCIIMAYSLQLILPALACSDHKNAMAELNNPHDRYECLVLRRTLPEWDGTKLDRNEHNLLGTLQFVAKALEI